MLQLQKAKPKTNIGVLLNDWPQRIPMEQLSVLELGKSQFLQFKREYPETHPLFITPGSQTMPPPHLKFWVETLVLCRDEGKLLVRARFLKYVWPFFNIMHENV